MKKIIVALTIALIAFNTAEAANIDSQIKAQQQSQADMKKKIKQYNEIAKKKSQESKNLLSQLSRLRQSANDSQTQITNLEQQDYLTYINSRLKKIILTCYSHRKALMRQ